MLQKGELWWGDSLLELENLLPELCIPRGVGWIRRKWVEDNGAVGKLSLLSKSGPGGSASTAG